MIQKLEECAKKGPVPLESKTYNLSFMIRVSEGDSEVEVEEVMLKDSTLQLREVESCMAEALHTMRAPLQVLALRRRRLFPEGPISPESRALLGQAEALLLLEAGGVVVVGLAAYVVVVYILETSKPKRHRHHPTTAEPTVTAEPLATVEPLVTAAPVASMAPTTTAVPTVAPVAAKHESTPLLTAVFRERIDAVRLLLSAGADPNVRGDEGDSPLRWCAQNGLFAIARLLLLCGADKTIHEGGGPTGMNALGFAATRLNVAMVQLLLSHGADPLVGDADRRTTFERLQFASLPEDAASQERLREILQLLGAPRGS